MVAQLLAHIDTLEAAILTLDEKIEAMLAAHAKIVELLCTIPGVATRTAQAGIDPVHPRAEALPAVRIEKPPKGRQSRHHGGLATARVTGDRY